MSRSFTYRPELDGIRAFAVVGVIVYHLDPAWLRGGFIGVDVFFVLSGYLITTLLLLEGDEHGRIDLAGFWSRRARRLLPAMVVMVAVVAIYYAVFVADLDKLGLRGDLLATLFYVSNWRFIAAGQSYFEQYAAPSPVRHTWSLAIEEQFYLVWPALVAVLALRRVFVPLIVVGGAASIVAMAMLYDPADPSRAYFGSGTRVHQLLIGSLLAIVLRRGAAALRLIAKYAALPAAIGLVVIAVTLGDTSGFYYQGGSVLIAVLTAALVAGLEGADRTRHFFRLRPIAAVGIMSYGLYLWHWPVITVVTITWGSTSELAWAAVAVSTTIAISLVSFFTIERPVRRSRAIGRVPLRPRLVLAAVPVVTTITVAVVLVATADEKTPEWASESARPAVLDDQTTPGEGRTRGVVPMPESVVTVDASRPPMIAVVGDSVAVSLLPGLRAQADERGFTLIEAAIRARPIGDGALYSDDGIVSPYYEDRCRLDVAAARDAVVAAAPDVIIWHDLQSSLSRRADDGTLLTTGTQEWRDDLAAAWTDALDELQSNGAEVAIILPPLRSTVADCAAAVNPSRCADILRQDSAIREATEAWWAQVRQREAVQMVQIDDMLCPTAVPCPATIDGIEVRLGGTDQTHFSEPGALWLAPLLLDRLQVSAS